jgi:hypothetical protein
MSLWVRGKSFILWKDFKILLFLGLESEKGVPLKLPMGSKRKEARAMERLSPLFL